MKLLVLGGTVFLGRHVVAAALGDTVSHYTFMSSVSAYRAYPPGRSYDETAPLHEGAEGYGPLKARAEEAIEAALSGRVAIVRAGLIVGPHDPTDRFTYWPRRIARGDSSPFATMTQS